VLIDLQHAAFSTSSERYLQFTIYINKAHTSLENISCQPVEHGKRECIRVFLIVFVFIHRSSNPCKAYTYRILNLSYIETIMENYELQL